MAEKKENWFAKKIAATKKRAQKDKKYKKRVIAAWAIALTIWTGAMFFLAQIVVSLVALFFSNHGDFVCCSDRFNNIAALVFYEIQGKKRWPWLEGAADLDGYPVGANWLHRIDGGDYGGIIGNSGVCAFV